MKFTFAALALVAATTSAFDCRTKEGQVHYIKGLINQWSKFKRQVAANAVISGEQDTEEADRVSLNTELSSVNDEKLANLTDITNAKKTAVNSAAAAAAQAIDDDLAAALAELDTQQDNRKNVFSGKKGKAQGSANGKKDKLNQKKVKVGQQKAASETSAATKRDLQLARAQSKYEAALTSAGLVQTVKNSKANELNAEKQQNATDVRNAKLAANQANYEEVVANLEASKRDAAATLASIDNAGTTGIAFPADCLLEVGDVIAEVKNGLSASDIWKKIVMSP